MREAVFDARRDETEMPYRSCQSSDNLFTSHFCSASRFANL